jgi:hypothetical protein
MVVPTIILDVENRTEVFDTKGVKGGEFLRKMRVVARRKKLTFR